MSLHPEKTSACPVVPLLLALALLLVSSVAARASDDPDVAQATAVSAEVPETIPTAATNEEPEYIRAFVKARDLIFNREYDAARKALTEYGVSHLDDPIEEVGEAMLELLALAELRDYRRTQHLDAVFARARFAAYSWIPAAPDPVYAGMLAGAADAIDALWQLKTGSTFSGLSLARKAINRIENAAAAPEPSLDARGFYSMYLYMRGRYGSRYISRYIPFLDDTRPVGKAGAQKCVKEAPTMGPVCHLFLLYVAKWETRWDDLDRLADEFRRKYPASMFAALIQAEGLLLANRPEKALSVLVDVGRYDTDFALHHLWLGRVYWEGLQQPLPAEEFISLALEKGLNQHSRMSEAHTVLGEIALKQGYYAEAKTRLKWAREMDPDNQRAKYDENLLEELMKKKK